MSESNKIRELLQQGVEAARSGNKIGARELFQQVVDLDEHSEQGWYYLARVMDTDEERRVCLANVLFINPDNENARKAMEQIEARAKQQQSNEEVIPGITRRQLTLIVGGGAVVIVLLLVVVIAVISGNNAQVASQTRDAQQVLMEQTGLANTQAAIFAEQTAVQESLMTPTPTTTPTPNLPPTWTPSPAPTEFVAATPLPQPEGLFGNLAAWSGRDSRGDGLLEVGYFPLNGGGQFTQVGTAKGVDVRISADGQRLLYVRRYVTEDIGPEIINLNGTLPETIGVGLPITQLQMVSFCNTANFIAFAAISTDAPQGFRLTQPPTQVYLLDLSTKTLSRLTNDDAVYTYPALSPDCTRIAAVKSPSAVAGTDEDIVLIDVATLGQTPVTTDAGNFIETMVGWAPDNMRIVYAAAQAGSPNNHDIIVRNADGGGTPSVVVNSPADDVYPVFSPDGQYIAYSSNERGQYDIFILNLANPGDRRQLTNSENQDFAGGWWSPS
ncbi:MAG: PD40 domain-containing protein [Anaerolineaceae bacterium]|nr:PD40 domain-containing protein [Anaerolineaceae bacterium]